MMNKRKNIILTIVATVAFIIITVGTTLAFFGYIKEGSTENSIQAGAISFIYEEVNKMGNGIKIEDALPISDTEGKEGNYFSFKITSSTADTIDIPYEITVRKTNNSDDLDEYVKLYLTRLNGETEEEKVISMFSDLDDTNQTLKSGVEKTLYKSEIIVGAENYVDNYRLRMWLNDNPEDGKVINYSGDMICRDSTYTTKEDCEANDSAWVSGQEYNNQNKTFSIKVNVYANGEQATEEKIASATTVEISGIKVNDSEAIENTDSTLNYDYYIETNLEDENSIEILPLNDEQTYTVENITEVEANTIRRVSTNQDINLVLGDNYLKATVTSANKKESKVYVIKVVATESLISYKNVTGNSILEILKDNDLKTGYYNFKINNKSEEYKVHLYTYNEDLVINENTKFGKESDVSREIDGVREYAKHMVIVKVNGNLTNNAKIEPYYNDETGFGGPKGFTLYVTGTLTNNGTIDNSHGAYATGENVYLYKNSDGTYEYVPATGATGGTGFKYSSSGVSKKSYNGNPGENGTGRSTGGGGTGMAGIGDEDTFYVVVSDAGAGTSYSGGTGSGGIDVNTRSGTWTAGAGGANGGAGGNAASKRYDSGWAARFARGGAGNPGGMGSLNNSLTDTYAANSGTGGLLVIYANTFVNSGTLSAHGTKSGEDFNGSAGGASGGGSINIFTTNNMSSYGTLDISGGEKSAGEYSGYSGAGGRGTYNIGVIRNGDYSYYYDIKLEIPDTFVTGDDYPLPKSYNISVSNASVSCKINGNVVTTTKNLSAGTYTVICSTSNITPVRQVTKTFTVIDPPTISGDSVVQILENNSLPYSHYYFHINTGTEEKTYPVHVYSYEGNQTWNKKMQFGDSRDVASGEEESQMANNMVVVKVNGNLTIGSNGSVLPYYSKYGGPKGFTLYVTGTLTNNGTIDNSHGAYAYGENVYLYKNSSGTYETVGPTGATGGKGVTMTFGANGNNGTGRMTGGGGSGGSTGTKANPGGNGGRGTSYSGGTGGGGTYNTSSTGTILPGNGSDNGGAGGFGSVRAGGYWTYASGGAGNGQGMCAFSKASTGNVSANVEPTGESGTGGLLILYANKLVNNGSITAKGSDIPDVKYGGESRNASGGASGGGSINIFIGDSSSTLGTISAAGGISYAVSTSYKIKGGDGGNGTITISKIENNSCTIINN